jgi:7-carboxy-7-deazaguanine synthase
MMIKRVQEIIPRTVQGEGKYSGTFASFIRFYGCNVGCWFCDTGYSAPHHGKDLPFFDVDIAELLPQLKADLVVLTGGEPLLRPELPSIIRHLISYNKHVSLETSGIGKNVPSNSSKLHITLSPKEHCSNFKVNPSLWLLADEVKLVISKPEDFEYYEERLPRLKNRYCPIYLQPEWTSISSVMEYILDCLEEYPFLKVSAQTHKFLGLR